jgi:hypothetical protein
MSPSNALGLSTGLLIAGVPGRDGEEGCRSVAWFVSPENVYVETQIHLSL